MADLGEPARVVRDHSHVDVGRPVVATGEDEVTARQDSVVLRQVVEYCLFTHDMPFLGVQVGGDGCEVLEDVTFGQVAADDETVRASSNCLCWRHRSRLVVLGCSRHADARRVELNAVEGELAADGDSFLRRAHHVGEACFQQQLGVNKHLISRGSLIELVLHQLTRLACEHRHCTGQCSELVTQIGEALQRIELVGLGEWAEISGRGNTGHDVEHPRLVSQMDTGDVDDLVGDLDDLGVGEDLESALLQLGDLGNTHAGEARTVELDQANRKIGSEQRIESFLIDVCAPNHHLSGVDHGVSFR